MSLLSRHNVVSRVSVLIHLPDDLGDDVRFTRILFPFWVEFSLSHKRLGCRWKMIMFLGLLHSSELCPQSYFHANSWAFLCSYYTVTQSVYAGWGF